MGMLKKMKEACKPHSTFAVHQNGLKIRLI
jgi:hypothetical protein